MAHPLFPLDEDELVRLYEGGMSKAALGQHFGCAQSAIGNRLVKLGFPKASTRSEASRVYNARKTADQRAADTSAAHAAVRGMKRSYADLCKRAEGKSRVGKIAGDGEAALFGLLARRGVNAAPQGAIGKYNVDLAMFPIAVEVFGRKRRGAEVARMHQRVKDILDAGWLLVVVWGNKAFPMTGAAADYIVALHKEASGDPSMRRQYRVVRGDGKIIAAGSGEEDDLPGILASVPGQWSRTSD